MKDYPWGKGTPTWTRDAAANDSDKTILTVPAGKIAEIRSLSVALTSTATVGNRNILIEIGDGTNVVGRYTVNVNQAASLTYYYDFTPGMTRFATAPYLQNNIPASILLAGYTVRVYDSAAVDAAADDMTVVLHYVVYDA